MLVHGDTYRLQGAERAGLAVVSIARIEVRPRLHRQALRRHAVVQVAIRWRRLLVLEEDLRIRGLGAAAAHFCVVERD